MEFIKMNGLGNDFIVVAHFKEPPQNAGQLAQQMCDRYFGVGADGLVFILPSEKADIAMRIFNADGSEPEQCGNAIRCVAKYAYDHGMVKKKRLNVDTLAGIQTVWLTVDDADKVQQVKVDMGHPILQGDKIPVAVAGEPVISTPLPIGNESFRFTAVSMGNPHAVIAVDNAAEFPVERWGPLIETHEWFPRRTNVEFITVQSPQEITMRVWERGVGQTLACGTGACAAVVASVLNDQTSREVLVHLKGGDLFIEWNKQDGHVYMTGPAEAVFSGKWLKTAVE